MAQKATQAPAILPTAHESLETAYELMHISSGIVAGWSNYQQEMISFHPKRILEGLQFQQKLMCCKSFQETCDLGQNFFATSSKQYCEEVQKLGKFSLRIMPSELTGMSNEINC